MGRFAHRVDEVWYLYDHKKVRRSLGYHHRQAQAHVLRLGQREGRFLLTRVPPYRDSAFPSVRSFSPGFQ